MNPTLLQNLPVVSFATDDRIIREGEPVAGLYFLEEGELEIHRGGVLINRVEDYGAVLGEMSWLLGSRPTATVVAATPCRLRHVADPAAFCQENPQAALEIARVLARRLDSMAKYLVAIKEQFREQNDHLGLLDEMLASMLNRHPRDVPRRDAGH